MTEPSPTSLLVAQSSAAVPLPWAVERAGLWLGSALGACVAGAVLVFAVATQCGGDAARIAEGKDYPGTLVSALAVAHARRSHH